MKAIFFALMMTFSSLSVFAGSHTLTCTNYPGGYDVETVNLTLKNDEIVGLVYTNYQGEAQTFKKVASDTFVYSSSGLVLNYLVTVSADQKQAFMTVVYKTSGQLLSSSVFDCN